jgi:hypothetical protein
MADDTTPDEKPLKLRAQDPADMDVIAAVLQDALVPVSDMAYLGGEKRFVLIANRFCWHGDPAEDSRPSAPGPEPEEGDVSFEDAEGLPPFARVNAALCFDKVARVRYRGLKPGTNDEILSLLTITTQPDAITLLFAGEAAVRLEVEAVRCHLEDVGRPWPTRWRPQHEEDGPDAEASGGPQAD